MSGISSGVGLISGINTQQLIDQLIALERRPITNLETRVKAIDTQRTKFLELSAKLLAVRNSITDFNNRDFFRRFSARSSNDALLTATASTDAVAGSTTFRVHSLVSNHAVVTRGFADADRTSVGVGSLTVEVGGGRVNPATELDVLNGGNGVRRGSVRITDRSGASAVVDLSGAFTVDDVLSAVNDATGIRVRASVTGLAANGAAGDRIVIEDLSGGTGNLTVAEERGGFAAADLGIAGNVAAARLDGRNVLYLSMNTSLSLLNDGNGVDRLPQGAQGDDLVFNTSFGNFGVLLTDVLRLSTDLRAVNDGNGVRLGVIRITDRTGATADVDLTAARTVLDVRDAINGAGLAVSATTVNSRFLITDTSNATGVNAKKLKIEDVSGFTAADLGIAGEVDGAAVNGRDIYRVSTVGDLIRAINYAPDNGSRVEASLSADGTGMALRALGFENTVTVIAGVDDQGRIPSTARDLGLLNATFTTDAPFQSRRLLGGLNTVLLNTLRGGSGVAAGMTSLTDGLGRSVSINFSSAQTLHDVVDLINVDSTTGLTASLNRAGNGIVVHDESGGAGPMVISDVSGTLATDLGISGTFDPAVADAARSGNLQLQYIARSTSLSSLNFGRGVPTGAIRITDSLGGTHVVNVGAGLTTVGSVIDFINTVTPDTLSARINDHGDGILITDTAGGSLPLTIVDETGSQTATALHLVGTAKSGQNFIDGSYETKIDIGPADTLRSLASRLNALGGGFSAAVVSDGGSVNPFSLTLNSSVSGRRGAMVVDSGNLDLGFDTLTEGRDAVVGVQSSAGSPGFLVRSSTNQLENVMEGVTINLTGAGDEDVTLTVDQDLEGMIESIQSFVEKYNDVQSAIDQATSFNPDTLQRGVLLGDGTVDIIRSRLQRVMVQPFAAGGSASRLLNVGLRFGEQNRLQFDAERFKAAYAESPDDVERLFTTVDTGFGDVLQETLDGLTQDFDGVLTRKDQLLADQQDVLNDRVEALNILLAGKRRRLETQFASLETALAGLQGQQNALGALSQLTG